MPRVVFVLGAGASRPYGLPTSSDLRAILLGGKAGDEALVELGVDFERIVSFLDPRELREDPNYSELFARARDGDIPVGLGVARAFVNAALVGVVHPVESNAEGVRRRFFGSQRVSIDAFIAKNPLLEKIAKHAVAAVLTLCEREERLEADWYQQFLEHLMRNGSGPEEFGVISFNYDRSFERYFKRAYLHNYTGAEQVARMLYSHLHIVHPYGVLGSLEGNSMPPLLEYGNVKQFGYAINQMEFATPAHEPLRAEIGILLDGVDRVVFLGFGFWKENLELINLDKSNCPEIYASAFSLPATVMEDVKAKYPNIIFGARDQKLLDFVLSYPVFR